MNRNSQGRRNEKEVTQSFKQDEDRYYAKHRITKQKLLIAQWDLIYHGMADIYPLVKGYTGCTDGEGEAFTNHQKKATSLDET